MVQILLTQYLRISLGNFARLPQGTLFRYLLRNTPMEDKGAMTAETIEQSNFTPGERIMGLYRIIYKDNIPSSSTSLSSTEYINQGYIELEIDDQQKWGGNIGGAMVFSVQEKDNNTIFRCDTIMWDTKNINDGHIPMAYSINRYFHELTSMSLLIKPVTVLQNRHTQSLTAI